MSAVNEYGIGDGVMTPIMTAKYPFEPPTAPEAPEVRDVSRDSMTVIWKEPSSDGGSVITGYYVEMQTGLVGSWVRLNRQAVDAQTLTYRVRGLAKGKEYSFRYFLNHSESTAHSLSLSKLNKPY